MASMLSAADPPRMVIIQPGYPGSTKDAESFVGQLSEHLERKAGLQGLSGEYHNDAKRALTFLQEKNVSFGLVSLGFYLEHRQELGLRALLQSKPKDNFVIVSRMGELKDISALGGQPVAGGPLQEATFLEKVAFQGKAKVASWDSKPVLFASRALRDLVERKKYSALVLTGRDYTAFKELYAKTLEKIAESDYYPPAFLVAFHREETRRNEKREVDGTKKDPVEKHSAESGPQLLPDEVLKRVVRAFSGLSEDPRGKEILKTMGAEGFEEVHADWLKELEGKYDAKVETK